VTTLQTLFLCKIATARLVVGDVVAFFWYIWQQIFLCTRQVAK